MGRLNAAGAGLAGCASGSAGEAERRQRGGGRRGVREGGKAVPGSGKMVWSAGFGVHFDKGGIFGVQFLRGMFLLDGVWCPFCSGGHVCWMVKGGKRPLVWKGTSRSVGWL